MPRGFKKEISQETIDKVKELNASGMWRKQIAKTLFISYNKVCEILSPKKEKIVITSRELAEIESIMNTTSPKQIALKYNRTLGEMRDLLKKLGWTLPSNWEEINAEEYKEKIQQYLDSNMSFKDIGEKLGLDANKVYYICHKLGFNKRPKVKNVIEPMPEKVTKSYQEILRETADSMRDRLRKQYA